MRYVITPRSRRGQGREDNRAVLGRSRNLPFQIAGVLATFRALHVAAAGNPFWNTADAATSGAGGGSASRR